MTFARSDFRVVSDGLNAYIGGGCTADQKTDGYCEAITANFTRFNFATETWTVLTPMPRPRYRYAAVYLNGAIYYVGGRLLNDSFIPEIDVFNISAGTWTTREWFGANHHRSDFACWTNQSTIYCTGGYSETYDVAYNSTISLDTSNPLAAFITGALPERMISSGDNRVRVVNNKVYVFGGFEAGNFNTPIGTLEMYDPSTMTWTMKANMTIPRGNPASVVIGNKIYMIGGEIKIDGVSSCVDDISIYDPATNMWTPYFKLALPRFRFSAIQSNGIIYDFGGQGAPVSGKWPVLSKVAALDTKKADTSSALVGGPFWSCLFVGILVMSIH